MTAIRFSFALALLQLGLSCGSAAERVVIEPAQVHLRIEGPREWTSFSAEPDASSLTREFEANANQQPVCLKLRRSDVKQNWEIKLNDQTVGTLAIDENDMVEYFAVPAGVLRDGKNRLTVMQKLGRNRAPDDIHIGEIVLIPHDRDSVLNESTLHVAVKDAQGRPIPARITVTAESGALQSVGYDEPASASEQTLAVRPGIVYTSNGEASVGLPAGRYRIRAGRGFEYSLDTTVINTAPQESVTCRLNIERVVDTVGYVACDTHVHTLTHSGHGDATVEERMITLAAEGIELPVATDHNVQIDHRPFAKELNVAQYFTPVIGNEVTTSVGHFNIWPVQQDAPVADHRGEEWGPIFEAIYATPGVKIAILNHGRDLHGGTTPFGPLLHHSAAGINWKDWPMRFNAMEVVNSSATQTNVLQLFHDWMGLLNAGYRITPVGCSDSHDVGRHFVGQGRTYIRCDDQDPSKIDVDSAADAFAAGEVLVSYGLLCEMTVDDDYRSGQTVSPSGDTIDVSIAVRGPHWTDVDQVQLYANGQLIRSETISVETPGEDHSGRPGELNWTLSLPSHDVHLVAIALGPGIEDVFWKTAKPYKPDSPEWVPRTIGCSGAIWVDADKDGRRWAAVDYARQLVAETDGDLRVVVERLESFDAAVATQAAHLLQQRGLNVLAEATREVISDAAEEVKRGFTVYQQQWRDHQLALVRTPE